MTVRSKGKKDKLSAHKKKAWAAFSIYIRTRDCLKTTGTVDQGICVTCKKPVMFKQLQAGHFIDGRNNAVLFSERGVHAQCGQCNSKLEAYGGKSGNKIEYFIFMEKTYGREVIDELIAESHTTVIYKKFDYDRIADEYKTKTTELLALPV